MKKRNKNTEIENGKWKIENVGQPRRFAPVCVCQRQTGRKEILPKNLRQSASQYKSQIPNYLLTINQLSHPTIQPSYHLRGGFKCI
jgi:hypothetical protein